MRADRCNRRHLPGTGVKAEVGSGQRARIPGSALWAFEKTATATEPIIMKTLDMLRVDHLGLDHGDRKILNAIIETFGGGPVGLSTLAAAVAEEMETLETVHEPYLLQIGFLERTPKGRCVTPRAREHLGVPVVNPDRLL